jgi:hypothetical protein
VPGGSAQPLIHLDPARFDRVRRARPTADIVSPDVGGETVMAALAMRIASASKCALLVEGLAGRNGTQSLSARDGRLGECPCT